MTNYEKYKKEINIILDKNTFVAVDRNTNKLTSCKNLKCEDCLFSSDYNDHILCAVSSVKWLVAEYTEPEVEWSKIPIDTPVLVSDDGVNWRRRYFVRRSKTGLFCVYSNGTTSWSADNCESRYKYAKLWEMK